MILTVGNPWKDFRHVPFNLKNPLQMMWSHINSNEAPGQSLKSLPFKNESEFIINKYYESKSTFKE